MEGCVKTRDVTVGDVSRREKRISRKKNGA